MSTGLDLRHCLSRPERDCLCCDVDDRSWRATSWKEEEAKDFIQQAIAYHLAVSMALACAVSVLATASEACWPALLARTFGDLSTEVSRRFCSIGV